MRDDFNKQLTERERIGHSAKFHEVRGGKLNRVFDEDAKGGTVSIHAHRRNTNKVRRKSFSENLNPLRNFIRCNVGRPWNKVFSELNKAFDRRKVVNNHLFDYVEVNAKLIDGKVCVLHNWRNYRPYDPVTGTYAPLKEGYYDERWVPIKEDSTQWYVHPVDGLLKENKSRQTRRQVQAQREAERLKIAQTKFKWIDNDHHLYIEDGIWWVYTIKDDPAPVEQYAQPNHITYASWVAMTKEQKETCGVKRMIVPRYERLSAPPNILAAAQPGQGRHYASKQAASRKVLKQFGLVGTAEFKEDEVARSHREMSKYRKAA